MRWLNRILLAVLFACVVAYLPRRLYEVAAMDDRARIERERDGLVQANAQLREEIRLLRAEVEALTADAKEVERIAREDLNLVRPGQVVFEVERPEPDERAGE
jgi:cell division protein FtsB